MKLKVTLVVVGIIFSGCSFDSSKFVPEFLQKSAGHSTDQYSTKINKEAINVIRDGVTFSDGSYITPQGEGEIILPKGYYYVSSYGGRIMAANKNGEMLILKSNGEELARVKLDAPLVTGVAYDRGVAYLLQGNKIGLYDPFKKKIYYQKELKGGSVIDNRLANPIVTRDFIAIPTLDGKLVFITLNVATTPKVLEADTIKTYSNIIYAKIVNGKIVLATPHRIIILANGGKKEYRAKVADLTIKNGIIYLLTRDGKVEKLTLDLEPIAVKKFAYADFATIAAFDGKVYAFAKSGSLVVLDDNLQKHKVYSVGAAHSYSYVSGKYLYIDDRKVDLSALSYE